MAGCGPERGLVELFDSQVDAPTTRPVPRADADRSGQDEIGK